jgi:5-keto-L-gluconate epimerase
MAWHLGLIVPVQAGTPFSPFLPREWPGALSAARAAGWDTVELAIVAPDRLDAIELLSAVEAGGLPVSSLTTGQAAVMEELSLTQVDDAARERAVARIQAHMRLARSLGAIVIVGSLQGADGTRERLIESLRACAQFDPEVRLALEPLNRYESRIVNTVEEGLYVVDAVACENLGLLVDTFHANVEERSIPGALRAAGDRLFHVHVADSNRHVPGQGHLRFDAVWDALHGLGYRGAVVVEALPEPSAEALLAARQGLPRSGST